MGVWGPGIYQNDISDDVRSYFKDQLHRGKNASEITRALTERFGDELADTDDNPNFWLALADVQWEMGRLLPSVKEQALRCLKDGSGLIGWERLPKKQQEKRRNVLEKLYQKLNTQQPPEKEVKQYRLYHCPWKIGDVFALPLLGTQAKALGMEDKCLLLEKAGEREYHPGHTIPVMYVKFSETSRMPESLDAYNELEYIKISVQWIDTTLLKKPSTADLSVSAEMINSIDEQGLLTQYRISLITTSGRSVPKNLVYLGNFAGSKKPQKEFVPPWDVNIPAYFWKEVEENILTFWKNRDI